MPSIKDILAKYKPVVAQTVKETKGRDYVTAGDMLNFAVSSAFDKLRNSSLNKIRNSTTTPQQPVTTTPQQPVTTTPQPGYIDPEHQVPALAAALAEQKRLSELQAAQRQADYIQRTRGLVNPGLNNPVQNIPIRTRPQPGIAQPRIPNPPSAPIPGFHELPLVITNPGYEEFIKNATDGFNQTKTGQQYQTALQALEAFKKANPSPGSYSGYGADPQLKAQYDQVYGNYRQAMIPYFQGLSEYQKEYKTQGLV